MLTEMCLEKPGKTWKSQGIWFQQTCGHPGNVFLLMMLTQSILIFLDNFFLYNPLSFWYIFFVFFLLALLSYCPRSSSSILTQATSGDLNCEETVLIEKGLAKN